MSTLLKRDFKSLTNLDDIRESLRLLDEEETRIDASLDRMLSEQSQLVDILGTLDVLRLVLCPERERIGEDD